MDSNNNNFNPSPQVEKPKTHGVAIAALVCGIVSWFINPLYLVVLAAIVLGIVGLIITKGSTNKILSGVGLGLGVLGMIVQIILDIIITFFTGGLGVCSLFI